jgi:hypothetical protein
MIEQIHKCAFFASLCKYITLLQFTDVEHGDSAVVGLYVASPAEKWHN